jgi:hypothetical protein
VRAVLVVAAALWLAAAAADPLQPLLACRALKDDTARLACFDRESATLAPAVPSAAVPPQLSPEQKFGLGGAAIAATERERGQARSEVEAVAAKLSALRVGADGRYVFTLDNGQVWRQLSPGSDLLLQVGDTVRIVRGALGSYQLLAPTQRGCKVSRVR